MRRAKVLDWDLQRQLIPYMESLKPLPSVYFTHYIAANQASRADNCLKGTHSEQLNTLRENIREFKTANNLDTVILVWSANTERFSDILPGVNDTAENLLAAIKSGHSEIAPSTLFALASILENLLDN